MAATKSEVVRKRLMSAGLSTDVCTRYMDVLRAFLSARLTKVQYEERMATLLPKDKIHVHNSIIQDILCRAQQKRQGLRDLPIVTNLKKPITSRPHPKTINGAPKKQTLQKIATKRNHDDMHATTASKLTICDENGIHNVAKRPKTKATIQRKPILDMERTKPKTTKLENVERTSPPPQKPKNVIENTPKLPPPSPNIATASRYALSHRKTQVASTELVGYELPFQPTQPGCGMDYELFFKIRQRMRRLAMEHSAITLQDDVVGAMVHSVETQVKMLLMKAVRQRRARDGMRPRANLQCAPVRSCDMREPAKRNALMLGDERMMDLERLSMLL